MGPWIAIGSNLPQPDDLILFYQKGEKVHHYIWADGSEYDLVLKNCPAVTHWRQASESP